MFDAAWSIVRIRLARAAIFGWIEAEAALRNIHAFEPLMPRDDGGLIVACGLCIGLIGDIASVLCNQLHRGLLDTTKRIFRRALDKELEWTLKSRHQSQF